MREDRSLPSVILPLRVPDRTLSDPIGITIELPDTGKRHQLTSAPPVILSEEGEISRDEFFHWVSGKSAYVSVEQRGLFDTIFGGLPSGVLKSLAIAGEAEWKGLTLFTYGRDGLLVVRDGRSWGSLANVYKLFPSASSPKGVRLAVELAEARMTRRGFGGLDFKSVGRVTQDLVVKHCRYQPRPPERHMYMHLQSFKGARMEGVVFGASDVYDYDIKSAFPSYVSSLPGTNGMMWTESTEVIEDAHYAAALCDVYVSEHLLRGPIAVREGSHSLHFPIGMIKGVWLNKPEIDLISGNPDLGHIIKIHEGSWGIGGSGLYPYRRLLRSLYRIRQGDDFLEPYLKLVMAALWGKFISTYPVIKDVDTGEGWMQASPLYNPAFAAHVTSAMRCALYRRAMGLSVVGEFIDGVSTTRPLTTDKDSRFGSLVEKGRGSMILFSDSVKGCDWKNPEVLELARSQKDEFALELPMEYLPTLKLAHERAGPEKSASLLGKPYHTSRHVRLGSAMRFMGHERLRVGDLLEGTKSSYPPRAGEIRFFRFMRGVDDQLKHQPYISEE